MTEFPCAGDWKTDPVQKVYHTEKTETAADFKTTDIAVKQMAVDPIYNRESCSAVLYNNTNGLPTSEANTIAQTSDGFIWIGSYSGLIRYDGNTFERLDPSEGVTNVTSLYVDHLNRLWIGTNDSGVALMEQEKFVKWGRKDGMKSLSVREITEDEEGLIYVGTSGGVMMIDPDRNISFVEEHGLDDLYQ